MHIRLAALAATAVLAGLPASAHASDPVVVDGCSATVAADVSPGAHFGGLHQMHGLLTAGPIVVADTDDLMKNAVDGTLTCSMFANGVPWGPVLTTEQSYVVAAASSLSYTATPSDEILLCGTLQLRDAAGDTREFDLGCEEPTVVPHCTGVQFLPQPVRPIVEEELGC